MDIGVAGEIAWTAQLSSPVVLPVAIHSIQLPGQDSGRMTALVTPQHGRIAALEVTSGSLLAEGPDASHHTASPAILSSAKGAVALQHSGVLGTCFASTLVLPPNLMLWCSQFTCTVHLGSDWLRGRVVQTSLHMRQAEDFSRA